MGQLVYYHAELIQVVDAGKDRYQIRANVTKGQFLWQDIVFLRYAGPRFLENDIIEFVGTVVGLTTYTAVLGNRVTIPDISVVRAKLLDKGGAEGQGDGLSTSVTPPLEKAAPRLEVVDIQTRVTEDARIWWRYAWRLSVRNTGDQAVSFDASIEWHDKDGFIIDTAREYGLILDANEERTFTGDTLISLPSGGNVASVIAAISRQEISPSRLRQPEVIEVQTRVTEEASIWWRYAWRLIVRNAADQAVSFDASIEWHDKDGFIIDTAREYGLILDANEEKTFTGDTLISLPGARNVTDVVAKVLLR